MSQLDSRAIARLVDWARASRHLVVLSGAGMSTESGAIDDISSVSGQTCWTCPVSKS
jgi:NAD-dependent SIR2 family protein deacetylase